MTLNELMNKLVRDTQYLDWATDILSDLNLGQGGREIKVEINDGPSKQTHPAVLYADGLEMRLTEAQCEAIQAGIWAALLDKGVDHVEG